MTEGAKNNRSILVTGSSRGIGRAIAERLASSGFQVILHCRENLAAAEETRAAIVAAGGPNPRILRFDIADRAGCAAAISCGHHGSRRVLRRGLQRRRGAGWRVSGAHR